MKQKKNQRLVVLVGGGSGGHITPLLAVAEKIKQADPKCVVVHIGHKGDHLNVITRQSPFIDRTYEISAGKFRRYNGESFISHVLDIKTIILNIRDIFRVFRGIINSWFLLRKIKPENMMMKGGYVCVPVGIAAHLRKLRFFTHDSDVTPGLANKIISRWAYMHARGMPLNEDQENDPSQRYTGIPLQAVFTELQKSTFQYKEELGLHNNQVIFVVGGGLGARTINMAIANCASRLLENKRTVIIHITGKNLYDETLDRYKDTLESKKLDERIQLIDYTTELYKYSGAADVVIARAGATNLAEFAQQGKACIIIPNPVLTGGQQLHNAEVFLKRQAIEVIHETEISSKLELAITELLSDEQKRVELETNIQLLSQPDAAESLAQILLTEFGIQKIRDENESII